MLKKIIVIVLCLIVSFDNIRLNRAAIVIEFVISEIGAPGLTAPALLLDGGPPVLLDPPLLLEDSHGVTGDRSNVDSGAGLDGVTAGSRLVTIVHTMSRSIVVAHGHRSVSGVFVSLLLLLYLNLRLLTSDY